MNRAFIIRTLCLLPVWLWPIFLHDVAVYLRWRADLRIGMRGHVALAVSRQGRLVVTGYYENDEPGFAIKSGHGRHQPWLSRSIALRADVRLIGFRAEHSDLLGAALADLIHVPQPTFAFGSG